ncbi:hypothetical protein EG327_000474 [Venturia inaequalis]|uniref:Uncharacterized protein n=1 Tax=Venturia inaequalis TaxID=5025 RepID=A0A8H3YQ13_VENIN|nr:hypothetical protein EG327_000474 [Venturia inaequalis]
MKNGVFDDIRPFSKSDDNSVLSEAKDYIEENGRLYYAHWKDSRYLLPNGGQEQKRLNVQHQPLLVINSLHKAPLPKRIHNILDVGTGTGNHADPNCKFLLDDVENSLGLGNNEFDFIRVLLLHGFRNPARFITHALEALIPGGYLEIMEFEFPLRFHNHKNSKKFSSHGLINKCDGNCFQIGH